MTPITRPRHRLLLVAAVLGACTLALVGAVALQRPDAALPELPLAVDAPLGDEDGYVETGESLSPFADELPALARLDPELRAALQAAATDALADGVPFVVTSGWRSERYQQSLFDDAVREYGSEEEAGRQVATVTASAHVTGDAVDIGYTDADSWLMQHGADYGLCQIYTNEIWHFELATTPGGECPEQLPDASHT